MILYLDTSAAAKLAVEEAESAALANFLDDRSAVPGSVLASSSLLETELRRMAHRAGVAQTTITEVLRRLTIIDVERGTFRDAGLLPGGNLRSLDALHLAVAERIAADEFVTYDARQAEAAHSLGLTVVHPA